MSNICYRCGKEMDGYYVEEGDLTISSKRLVCHHCGWVLEGVYDSYEDEPIDDEPAKKEKRGQKGPQAD